MDLPENDATDIAQLSAGEAVRSVRRLIEVERDDLFVVPLSDWPTWPPLQPAYEKPDQRSFISKMINFIVWKGK